MHAEKSSVQCVVWNLLSSPPMSVRSSQAMRRCLHSGVPAGHVEFPASTLPRAFESGNDLPCRSRKLHLANRAATQWTSRVSRTGPPGMASVTRHGDQGLGTVGFSGWCDVLPLVRQEGPHARLLRRPGVAVMRATEIRPGNDLSVRQRAHGLRNRRVAFQRQARGPRGNARGRFVHGSTIPRRKQPDKGKAPTMRHDGLNSAGASDP